MEERIRRFLGTGLIDTANGRNRTGEEVLNIFSSVPRGFSPFG